MQKRAPVDRLLIQMFVPAHASGAQALRLRVLGCPTEMVAHVVAFRGAERHAALVLARASTSADTVVNRRKGTCAP